MQPTRFQRNGSRYYTPGDNPNVAFPSVTTILGKISSDASKKALNNWALKNPGAKEAAAARGSAIHAACEDYIRGRPVNVPDEYLPFWKGMPEQLDRFDEFIWSEKPLQPQWSYCIGEDGISRLWSHKHAYCGCPDLIGTRNGSVILADFKTSVGPYSRYFPKTEEERQKYKGNFSGWMKFQKCALQLAAYAIAAQETLGVHVDAAEILVSTPEVSQRFILRGHELESYRYRWLQKVRLFHEMVSEEEARLDLTKAGDLVAA